MDDWRLEQLAENHRLHFGTKKKKLTIYLKLIETENARLVREGDAKSLSHLSIK